MMKPALIIADEPTTALDVTIQAQILDLIRDAVQETTATLLITHDMGVIWEMCDRVAVMYASEIVETGPTREIFTNPAHPYTEALLASIPTLEGRPGRLPSIKGQVPSPRQYPTGCHFQNRCPYVTDPCRNRHPELKSIEKNRSARCLLARERVTKQQVQRTTDG
jgi:peptide/nickel transport system ATP-binding protein/oligopeptide transport system ATP-binding protein